MEDLNKILEADSNGMSTYEYLVNHCDGSAECMAKLVDNLRRVDKTGQFLASSARYLHAVDAEAHAPWLTQLIDAAIDVDRERRYIGSLLSAIWGADYHQRVDQLNISDDRFRRIYKRIFRGVSDNVPSEAEA